MEQLLHRTADESTYYAPPPGISLLCTTTNNYCSGQLLSKCCSQAAVVLLPVSTKSLWLCHPSFIVPFPQLVQQKNRITTRPKCSLTLPAGFIYPHPHVACISQHAAITPVSVLPWAVCFPYLNVFLGK